MANLDRNGTIDLRIWSDTAPLGELAKNVALTVNVVHVRGERFVRYNGKSSQNPARQNYVGFDIGSVQAPAQANAAIAHALSALEGTQLAAAIASGEAKAQLIVAAFRGDIDWASQLSPDLIAKAKAQHLRVLIEHYDRFKDDGSPLSVHL